jgi:putative two-component system response regulator
MYRQIFSGARYELFLKENGLEAVEAVDVIKPDIILLDVEMPVMDGITACGKIKENPGSGFIPILVVTSLKDQETITKIFKAGANDYVNKPFNTEELIARVSANARIKRMVSEQKRLESKLMEANKDLDRKVKERTRTIEETQEALLIGLAKLAEYRDPETGAHIERTRALCMALAISASMDERFSEQVTSDFIGNLYRSAPLHDIGKVGTPDNILNKPGKLTKEEFEEMKTHSAGGGKAIEEAEKSLKGRSFLETARKIAFHHHEKWDGSGYPSGLAGEEIPLEARIMAIADVYDALVNKRVYKPPFSHEEAVAVIRAESGKQLDPRLVEIFFNIEKEVKDIGEIG